MANANEQHPQNDDGTYAAHCTRCGLYVEDDAQTPAMDFLCEECEEGP